MYKCTHTFYRIIRYWHYWHSPIRSLCWRCARLCAISIHAIMRRWEYHENPSINRINIDILLGCARFLCLYFVMSFAQVDWKVFFHHELPTYDIIPLNVIISLSVSVSLNDNIYYGSEKKKLWIYFHSFVRSFVCAYKYPVQYVIVIEYLECAVDSVKMVCLYWCRIEFE